MIATTKIGEVNIKINRNALTLYLPGSMNGDNLKDWLHDNHTELDEFKKEHIKKFKGKPALQKESAIMTKEGVGIPTGKEKFDNDKLINKPYGTGEGNEGTKDVI